MFWIILCIFLIGPILAIPYAMAAGREIPLPTVNYLVGDEELQRDVEIAAEDRFETEQIGSFVGTD